MRSRISGWSNALWCREQSGREDAWVLRVSLFLFVKYNWKCAAVSVYFFDGGVLQIRLVC